MCHRHCPDGTFGVNSTRVCEMCDHHCRICDESQCHWCQDDYFLSGHTCVKECAEGYYGDEEQRECEACHHDCRSCKGPAYDDCDSCEDGMGLKNGQCVHINVTVTCRPDQFLSGKKECLPCSSDCATCSGPEANQCDTCDSGRFLSRHQQCVRRCPAGSFGNETSRRCEECVSGCGQCEDAQSCQRCQSSPVQLYLSHGRCVPECQSGYPEGGVCVACEPHCEECEGPQMCVSCVEQYLLHGHSCVGHCPQRYRPDQGECVRCPDGCSDCHANDRCTDCEQYFFLHEGKCVVDCPVGFYESLTTGACEKCHSNCVECDGPDEDDCVACSRSRPLRYRGQCLFKCPRHTYHDQQWAECKDCDRTCVTCSGPLATSCESCEDGMELDATGHCMVVNTCQSLYYPDARGECQPCYHTCHRCTGGKATDCLSCRPGSYLLNHTCVTQCPDGYYGDDDSHQCERCHLTCRSCSGHHSTDCLSCRESLFHLGHTCVPNCGPGYYGHNGTCVRCDHSCKACWGHSSHCTSCKDGYFLLDGECVYTCPEHYYPDTRHHTCQHCHATCHTCSDSGPIKCTKCYPGFHFMGGICSSPCLAGYYPSTLSVPQDSDVKCEACHASCTECKGAGPSDCTECPALQRLATDGRCLSCCGEGQRMDGRPIPWECCQCQELDDGCVLGVNFRFVEPREQELGEALEGVVVTLVLGSLGVGLALFLVLWLRSTAPRAPIVRLQGYEKVPVQATPLPPDNLLQFRDGPDDDEEDEEGEEDCDIVYMGQDGTVYHKFKYGLLDEHDDEPELEYDDEGYTMTEINASTDT
ncbi:proprotein convertase subtilisin/kexin type 5-like isoform X2 [Sardina pilchardus]